MSNLYIDEPQRLAWNAIAEKLAKASREIEEARTVLISELGLIGGPAWKALDRIEESIAGQAYAFTPQPEWTGGDSSDPKNFKVRRPHILG